MSKVAMSMGCMPSPGVLKSPSSNHSSYSPQASFQLMNALQKNKQLPPAQVLMNVLQPQPKPTKIGQFPYPEVVSQRSLLENDKKSPKELLVNSLKIVHNPKEVQLKSSMSPSKKTSSDTVITTPSRKCKKPTVTATKMIVKEESVKKIPMVKESVVMVKDIKEEKPKSRSNSGNEKSE